VKKINTSGMSAILDKELAE